MAWLARGSPESAAAARPKTIGVRVKRSDGAQAWSGIAEVDAFGTDMGYPQTRFDPELMGRVVSSRWPVGVDHRGLCI